MEKFTLVCKKSSIDDVLFGHNTEYGVDDYNCWLHNTLKPTLYRIVDRFNNMEETEDDNNIEWDKDIICDAIAILKDTEISLVKKPKYIPFDNMNECLKEINKHKPIGLLKDQFGDYSQIVKYDDCGLTLMLNEKLECLNWKTAFKIYHYADGTPFGKKVHD